MDGKLYKTIDDSEFLYQVYYYDAKTADCCDGCAGKIIKDNDGYKFIPDDKLYNSYFENIIGKSLSDLYSKLCNEHWEPLLGLALARVKLL